MGQREGQQVFTQVAGGGPERHRGQLHVFLQHIAQQVFLAAVVAVQGLLGAAHVCSHRIHAQVHTLGCQQLAHGIAATVGLDTSGEMVPPTPRARRFWNALRERLRRDRGAEHGDEVPPVVIAPRAVSAAPEVDVRIDAPPTPAGPAPVKQDDAVDPAAPAAAPEQPPTEEKPQS